MSKTLNALHTISDNGNEMLSKFIVYMGVGGSSVGIANKVAETSNDVATNALSLADWGAIVGIIGGLSLAVKSLSGIYFDMQKNKREKTRLDHDMNRRKDDK